MNASKSGSPGTERATRAAEAVPPAPGVAAQRWLLLAGLVLLVLGMIGVVLGTQIAPLFMPGTWLILLGFLAFAVYGILLVVQKPGSA